MNADFMIPHFVNIIIIMIGKNLWFAMMSRKYESSFRCLVSGVSSRAVHLYFHMQNKRFRTIILSIIVCNSLIYETKHKQRITE
jgi:hypothetical protein